MGDPKAFLTAFLGVLWAILPWPLVRWAAAFAALFTGLAWVWARVLARGTQVGTFPPVSRTFSGRKIEVRFGVANLSPLPSGLLFIFDSAGNLETWGRTRWFGAVGPFSRGLFAYTVRGRERGLRALGPVTVSGTDPTGLFPFVRRGASRSLVVYPPLFPVKIRVGPGVPSGGRRRESEVVDDPSRFRSYREFVPGDPLSLVSAAAWARTGVPLVRTWDRTVARPTVVVVDLRAALFPLKLRWALVERAVDTAASIVWDLLGQGESVWLLVADGPPGTLETLGPCKGWAPGKVLLERLALATPVSGSADEAWVVGIPAGAIRLFYVGPVGPGTPQIHFPRVETVVFPMEEGRALGEILVP